MYYYSRLLWVIRRLYALSRSRRFTTLSWAMTMVSSVIILTFSLRELYWQDSKWIIPSRPTSRWSGIHYFIILFIYLLFIHSQWWQGCYCIFFLLFSCFLIVSTGSWQEHSPEFRLCKFREGQVKDMFLGHI